MFRGKTLYEVELHEAERCGTRSVVEPQASPLHAHAGGRPLEFGRTAQTSICEKPRPELCVRYSRVPCPSSASLRRLVLSVLRLATGSSPFKGTMQFVVRAEMLQW